MAASSPKLELLYFDIGGKAEAIRLAAAYGNVAMTDTRLSRDEFDALKLNGTLPYGQVPALKNHDSGKVLAQSAAILKFVGKHAGLYPRDDDWLAARIDSLMDEEIDLFTGLTVSRYPWRFGLDAAGLQGVNDRECATTAKVRAQLNGDIIPKHLAHIEKILTDGGTAWLAGTDSPTVADFVFVPRLQWLVTSNDGIDPGLLAQYPKLQALVDALMALPAVVSYYAGRGEVYDAKTYTFKKEAEA